MANLNLSIEYLRLFSSFFNRSYLIDFINKKDNIIKRSIYESNPNTRIADTFSENNYATFFDYIYKQLKSNYRCEYVYLNEIFLNEILKNHDDNHTIITELIVNKSQADLVIINGTTTIYEIKTELDSLSRLKSQLDDYMLVFDKVFVITYSEMVDKLTQTLVGKYSGVGICILEKNGKLNKIKESISHMELFDKASMFSVLIRKEFEFFSEDYYEAKKTFESLSINEAHTYFKNFLFKRNKEIKSINSLPDSLKLAGYKMQNKLNKRQKEKFLKKLGIKIKEDF